VNDLRKMMFWLACIFFVIAAILLIERRFTPPDIHDLPVVSAVITNDLHDGKMPFNPLSESSG
jgi:hypothetical protein